MVLAPDIITVQYFIVRQVLNPSKQEYGIKLPDALGGKACLNWTMETFTDSWETRKWPHTQQRAALSEAKWKTCDVAVSFKPQQGDRKRMADIFRPSCSICPPPRPLTVGPEQGARLMGGEDTDTSVEGVKNIVCLYLIPPATAATQSWWDQHVPTGLIQHKHAKKKNQAWCDTERKIGW